MIQEKKLSLEYRIRITRMEVVPVIVVMTLSVTIIVQILSKKIQSSF